jgi:hypothetical protein
MSSKVIEDLMKVRELLSNPDHWAKRNYAYNAQNQKVDWDSPDACKFCLLGACGKVLNLTFEGEVSIFHTEVSEALEDTCEEPIPAFNDRGSTTHQNILDCIDKTIETVKAKEAASDISC